MRLFVLATLALLTISFAVPAATAGPQCLQVYPWSELCGGDAGGFLCAIGACLSADPSLPVGPVPMDCIQVIPWSYLCSGNVEAFVGYFVGDVAILS